MTTNSQLHNIVGDQLREPSGDRMIGPWRIPTVEDRDVAIAIKLVRSRPTIPREQAIETLRRIGQESAWVSDEQLAQMARFGRTPLHHLAAVRRRVNSWMSSIDDYVARVCDRQFGENRVRGIPTTIVLAGNDFVVAPFMFLHMLLAGANAIVKTSGADPLPPYLLTRAIMKAGCPAPQLLFIDSSHETGKSQVARAVEATSQSVVFGEDQTIEAVYSRVSNLYRHKMVPFWTGRSAAIVYRDAELDAAAATTIEGAIWSAGRTCLSTKKVFCAQDIADDFRKRLLVEAEKLRRGPYDDYYTDIGAQVPELHQAVLGMVATEEVFYERDLVMATCRPGSSVLKDEPPCPFLGVVFGPEDQLVAMANGTVADVPSRGTLSTAVWTQSESRFDDTARRLMSTSVTWNGPTNPPHHYASHQGVYIFAELTRHKHINRGRPSLFEMDRVLDKPWPW